jgi:hypothetical protein
MNRGRRAIGPALGVSSMTIVLPARLGSTWMCTRATPVGRKRTSSTSRLGRSRSSTMEDEHHGGVVELADLGAKGVVET